MSSRAQSTDEAELILPRHLWEYRLQSTAKVTEGKKLREKERKREKQKVSEREKERERERARETRNIRGIRRPGRVATAVHSTAWQAYDIDIHTRHMYLKQQCFKWMTRFTAIDCERATPSHTCNLSACVFSWISGHSMSQSLSQPCTTADPSPTQVTCPPLTYASHFVPVSSSSSPNSPYGECKCIK